MKEYIIQLPDDFEEPDFIGKINPRDWQILINYSKEFLQFYEITTSKKDIIINLGIKKEIYEEESNALCDVKEDISSMRISKIAEYLSHLAESSKPAINSNSSNFDYAKNNANQISAEIFDNAASKWTFDKRLDDIVSIYNREIEILQSAIKTKDLMLADINDRLRKESEYKLELYTKACGEEAKYKIEISEAKLEISNNNKYIEELKSKLLDLNNKMENIEISCRDKYQKELKMMEENYKVKMELLSQATNEKSRLIENIASYKLDNDNIITDLNKIKEMMIPINKFYGGTNEEKGTCGEEMIFNILKSDKRYQKAKLEDTSGNTSQGDLYFCFGKLKLLIEIKNKKRLDRKSDMEKFEFDIKEGVKYRSINCGLFVSLQCSTFPGRTLENMQLDFIDNIPVIYLYLENYQILHYPIMLLSHIVEIGNNNNEQNALLLKHFIEYYNFISLSKKNLSKELILKNREVNRMSKQLQKLGEMEDDLIISHKKLLSAGLISDDKLLSCDSPAENNENNENNKIKVVAGKYADLSDEELGKKIMKYYIKEATDKNKKRIMNLEDFVCYFGIEKARLKSIGCKDLIEKAKFLYVKKIVDEDVINKIRNASFKITRKSIIENKIISESNMRKIGDVVGCSPVEYILEKFIG